MNRGFTPRRVRESEDKIRAVCDEIIDGVCERGECDFVWDIAAPLPLIMIGDALGVPPEDRKMLLEWSDAMMSRAHRRSRRRAPRGHRRLRRLHGLRHPADRGPPGRAATTT